MSAPPIIDFTILPTGVKLSKFGAFGFPPLASDEENPIDNDTPSRSESYVFRGVEKVRLNGVE